MAVSFAAIASLIQYLQDPAIALYNFLMGSPIMLFCSNWLTPVILFRRRTQILS